LFCIFAVQFIRLKLPKPTIVSALHVTAKLPEVAERSMGGIPFAAASIATEIAK
jgi:hypothetical protein